METVNINNAFEKYDYEEREKFEGDLEWRGSLECIKWGCLKAVAYLKAFWGILLRSVVYVREKE